MALFDLIIRGGNVVFPDRVETCDLAISGGKFVEIARLVSGTCDEEIDAAGLHVLPGLIDPHVHFNEPGRTEWEGFSTGSSALAAGGGTLFFDMPLNSSPPVLDGASFDLKLAAAKEKSFTDFALWGGLTPKNLDRMEELAERGVVGFKAFMCDSGIDDFLWSDEDTLRKGMAIAAKLKLPVAVHAEDPKLTTELAHAARKAGKISARDFAATRPVVAEVNAIQTATRIAAETRCSLHVVHVSSAEGAIAAGGACETCPHYLLFTDEDLCSIGATLKSAPPVRDAHNQESLRDHVHSGLIPIIGSDHSPSPPEMKSSGDFFKIWGGVAGVQATLSVMLTLMGQRARDLYLVSRLLSIHAAKRFMLPGKGSIEVGRDADAALVDVAAEYQLKREDLLDRHKLSPYVGRKLRGIVRHTVLRGQTIFLDGKMVGPPRGRFVRPTV